MLGVIPNLIILKSYFTVSQLVNSYLKNPYLRKAFSIHPLLVGGDPHTTTSIYALIHYLERKWGVFFCMGGTGKIVSELKQLMIDCGIKIKTNTEAKEFIVENNRITKILTNNEEISNIDLVVCVAAAQRRGLIDADEAKRNGKDADNIAEGFRISGLGQLVEAGIQADRLITFGD